ncbi:hypothetical protein HW132_02140 [Brasilonema sp. CT11]|nr:hypothetical protein [Brasilonema sp. CT11]
MKPSPMTESLSQRIMELTEEEIMEAINSLRNLPDGKKAIRDIAKTFIKEEKAMFTKSVYFVLNTFVFAPLDAVNWALEKTIGAIY